MKTKLKERGGKGILKAVYITGSPGTGKTRTAKRLAKLLGGTHLELGEIARRRGFTLGYDQERGCAILDELKLSRFLREVFSKAENPYVLEAHFSAKLPSGIKPWVFVLRCAPETLARRLRSKGYSERKIAENLWAEILDFCLQEALDRFEAGSIHEVNVGGRSVKTVTAEMLKVIEGRQKPHVGSFNWLQQLERDGKLERMVKRGGAVP